MVIFAKMKIAFVFAGLPHYLVKLLNKINQDNQIELSVIIPNSKSNTLGSGVHTLEKGNSFQIINLIEYKTWYGKPFFKNFINTLKKNHIDAIVIGWPYFIQLVFNPILVYQLRKNNIKIIAREIPFSVPFFNEKFNNFVSRSAESQRTEKIFNSKIYFNGIKFLRKILYSKIVDFAFTYTYQGIEILASYGLSKQKIKTTLNSPDTDAIFKTINDIKQKPIEIIKNKFRLIHVGRLVYWKRVDLLIDAINILQKKYPLIELAIIGNGEEEANLKQKVKNLGLEQRVNFLGALYEGEEQSIEMLKSGIYVLAGMGGLSINEAMCHSLPIVCSIADGTEKHLIFEGKNGFYFEDNNLDSLVEAIRKILNSDMEFLGESSLKIIEEKINIQIVGNNFLGAFKKI